MSKLHGAAELNALPPDEFKKAVLNIVGFFDRIEPDKDDPHDLGGYPTSAAAIFLARHCSEMNSNFSRVTLGGVTVKDEEIGDWEITIRKMTPMLTRWRAIQDWWKEVKSFRTKKVYGAKVEDILNMEKLTSLTIKMGPKK